MNNEHKDHKISLSDFDFARMSYVSETDFEENIDESDLPLEMLRLLTIEDKQILTYQEIIELINLGTDGEKKEVKIGSSVDSSTKKRNNRSPQRVCRYFRLVLSRYAKAKHGDSGASVANEA